jgi:hypothetical protein
MDLHVITTPTWKNQFSGDERIYFMLDCYSADRNQQVQNAMRNCEVIMIFISFGMTDVVFPLDRSVFEILNVAVRKDCPYGDGVTSGV